LRHEPKRGSVLVGFSFRSRERRRAATERACVRATVGCARAPMCACNAATAQLLRHSPLGARAPRNCPGGRGSQGSGAGAFTNEMELVAAAYQGASPPPRSRGEPTPAAASRDAHGGLRKCRRHGCWKHEGYSEYSCFVLRRGPSATVPYVCVSGWQEGGRRRRREACLEMPQWKHVDGLAHGRAATPTIMDGQSADRQRKRKRQRKSSACAVPGRDAQDARLNHH
jgi:hypothetical protein